jgi:YrbI family 3-deoxy-D-manno-octulosonate 8-phosphate phosphatase
MNIVAQIKERYFAFRLRRLWPDGCRTIVFDFDGVMTDDLVITTSDGLESVVCSRSDGYGIEQLLNQGFRLLVLSRERNPVVLARCTKLNIEAIHGASEKAEILSAWCAEQSIPPEKVCYVGNDVNDLGCLSLAGIGVAVSDAHKEVRCEADLVLPRCGGRGAVRLLADCLV